MISHVFILRILDKNDKMPVELTVNITCMSIGGDHRPCHTKSLETRVERGSFYYGKWNEPQYHFFSSHNSASIWFGCAVTAAPYQWKKLCYVLMLIFRLTGRTVTARAFTLLYDLREENFCFCLWTRMHKQRVKKKKKKTRPDQMGSYWGWHLDLNYENLQGEKIVIFVQVLKLLLNTKIWGIHIRNTDTSKDI